MNDVVFEEPEPFAVNIAFIEAPIPSVALPSSDSSAVVTIDGQCIVVMIAYIWEIPYYSV